jgi:alpha-tubulin suppressor-like RCC1 family protein
MGRIYSWGSGKCGALGLGDDEDRTSPTLVKRWTAVQSLSIGGSHVLALSIDECVYAVGNNSYKQLGTLASMDNFYFGEVIPLRDEGIIKIAASGFSSLALSKNGTVFAWGRNTEGQCSGYESNPQYVAVPTKIKTLSRVVDITLGWCHGLAYTADEKLYYWGFVKNFDSNGQVEDSFTDVIELKTIPEKPVILRAGCYDTCVLTD